MKFGGCTILNILNPSIKIIQVYEVKIEILQTTDSSAFGGDAKATHGDGLL
jgi:hypothetical protein